MAWIRTRQDAGKAWLFKGLTHSGFHMGDMASSLDILSNPVAESGFCDFTSVVCHICPAMHER